MATQTMPSQETTPEQLEQLLYLVGRAQPGTINWFLNNYDIREEISTAYRTSMVIEYFAHYDGKEKPGDETLGKTGKKTGR